MYTLAATGLDQPGAMITHRLRVLLDDGADRTAAVSALKTATRGGFVRVRDLMDAAPGFDVFIDRTEVFLVLVGLTALLIGGLGVWLAGSVAPWLSCPRYFLQHAERTRQEFGLLRCSKRRRSCIAS